MAATVSPSTEDTYGIPPEVYHRRNQILAVLCLSLITIVIAVSSVNVALPALQKGLNATPSDLQWIVDSYALVFAGLLLPAGALGDRFGRKGALLIGLAIFALFSGIAAGVHSAGALIAARGAMGIGAALIMPATLSIIQNSFPPHERGKAIATWAGLAGAGGAIGPLVSGIALKYFWWGSIFFINIPFVLLLAALVVWIVPTSKDPHGHALDPIGSLLSIIGIVGLVYAIIEAPHWGWTSGKALGLFAAAVLVLVAFVRWELHTDSPTLDPRLFKNPGFSMGSLSVTMVFLVMFGMFFLFTQYLQFVQGYTALETAVRALPSAVVMGLTAPRTPAITERFGVKNTLRAGFLSAAAGLAVLATLSADSAYIHVLIGLVLSSAGLALTMPASTNAITASVPLSKAGVGSAVNDVTRELGGAIGIAVLGSVVNTVYAGHLVMSKVYATIPEACRGDFKLQAAPVIKEGIGQAMGLAGALQENPLLMTKDSTCIPEGVTITKAMAAKSAQPTIDAIRSVARTAFSQSTGTAFIAAAVITVVAGVVVTQFIPNEVAQGESHDD